MFFFVLFCFPVLFDSWFRLGLSCRFCVFVFVSGFASFCAIWLFFFGLVWFGLIWFDLVWFGLVWFGLVWFGLVWFGLVWFGLVWFGLVWFGLVWFGLVVLFLDSFF